MTKALQDFYPDDFAWCYGCGRLNPHGLHVRTIWDGDESLSRFTPRPEHMAMPGYVYGGLIASLIDCHAMGTASAAALRAEGKGIGDAPSPRFVTAVLNLTFQKPTPLGPELEIRARIVERSDRKARMHATLSAGGVVTASAEVVAVRMPDSMRQT
ncbi:MAG: PaaI family thioesterase [Gemmatimonadales bacterium]